MKIMEIIEFNVIILKIIKIIEFKKKTNGMSNTALQKAPSYQKLIRKKKKLADKTSKHPKVTKKESKMYNQRLQKRKKVLQNTN